MQTAKTEVLRTLSLMRMMRFELPDGQWEDGPEEIWDDLKACKEDTGALPDAADPCWAEYLADLQRNQAWWI